MLKKFLRKFVEGGRFDQYYGYRLIAVMLITLAMICLAAFAYLHTIPVREILFPGMIVIIAGFSAFTLGLIILEPLSARAVWALRLAAASYLSKVDSTPWGANYKRWVGPAPSC